MMRNYFVLAGVCLCVACSSSVDNRPQAPLDMRAVQEYNNKVYSGNTVPKEQQVTTPKRVDNPLNQSDKYQRVSQGTTRIQPHIGVGIGVGRYRHRHYPYYW
ncbi:hypothetical protein CBG46_00995 [Actinobacillus succinogenes]|uniref:Uncharacterized protein n=1 Tax=Actinobacillus succinogenes (strain ATCC 55618 / DSM 22257 / CCUG 43843 / 130Z) TaxID=339671 RepID=A6VMM6_ACTSZ|nr:hypothetical protein [Actinobacillus succinogenes]ABR74223.1 conserved hypothetical protein [Actinobacillus succinogenes 130Z]PHI39348.1 hypothetical protein CBG46_00995 [Actinobacillus succinogenes]